MKVRLRLLALGLLLLAPGLVKAQESEPLRVLLRVAPPFVLEDADGRYSGVSVELWRAIAEDLQLNYRFETVDLQTMLDEVAAFRASVGVGATTVTPEREEVLDFSHSFLSSGLAIAVRSGGGAWASVLERLFSVAFARAAGALALVLLLVGLLVWAFEHRANPDEFEAAPARGLWSAFWFAAVSMTTVGYGDKAPRSVGGQIVTLVWMFSSIILISFFTAAIATALTVDSLASGIDGPEDLPRVSVGCVTGTTSARWLDRREITARGFESPEAGLRALAAGEIQAFVHDEPILRWLIRGSGDERISVLPRLVEDQAYAFVLPPGSPLREDLNRALLAAVRSARYERLLEQYLGR